MGNKSNIAVIMRFKDYRKAMNDLMNKDLKAYSMINKLIRNPGLIYYENNIENGEAYIFMHISNIDTYKDDGFKYFINNLPSEYEMIIETVGEIERFCTFNDQCTRLGFTVNVRPIFDRKMISKKRAQKLIREKYGIK